MKQKNKRKTPIYWIIALTLIILVALIYSLITEEITLKHYMPLRKISEEVKMEATIAFLKFEEIIDGNKSNNINDALEHLNQAEWDIQTMLEVLEKYKSRIVPFKDPKLQLLIEKTLESLRKSRNIMVEDGKLHSADVIPTAHYHHFHKEFRDFILLIHDVEFELVRILELKRHQFYLRQVLLVTLTMILAGFIIFIFYRYNRRHINDLHSLQSSNENLNITLNSIGEAVIVIDKNEVITLMNPSAEHLTGWTNKEALGKIISGIFYFSHPEIMGIAIDPINQVLTSNKNISLTNQTIKIHRDNKEYQVTGTISPITGMDNNTTGAILVLRDVTEDFQIQEQIINNEKRFRQIALANWVWETNIDGYYTYCSENVIDILGYSSEEILGKSPFDFMPEEEASRISDIFTSITTKRKPIVDVVNKNITKSGKEVYLSTNGTPIFDNEGNYSGYRGSDKDITEQIHTQGKLKHLQHYLSNIIDSMPSILIGVDIETKVTQWNKKAEHSTGIPFNQAKGIKILKLFPQMISINEILEESIKTNDIRKYSHVTQHSDKKTANEDITIYPLLGKGIEGAVIRIDDVTEKMQIEEMMIQSEKMLSVGGLAAGMAHEINNPLAGMMQSAEVISIRLGKNINLPANIQAAEEAGTTMDIINNFMETRNIPRMLNAIIDSGKRVASIVDNMLSFARK
ncbi:MAG: PAS domain S-box protein, partial [Spirochaetales bacterium]|nr:PAS domain S-box protein [Spirochaetales bacterium]